MEDAQEKLSEFREKWEGARFRVPSTRSGLVFLSARPLREQISSIRALLHKILYNPIPASSIFGDACNVGQV